MRSTIRDVAKHAGVSVATVSRYLNHSPLIAADSAEKVRNSMRELNFQPNSLARSLAIQSSRTIAFVVDSTNSETFGDDYFLRIQYGIECILGKNGYYLMIVSISNDSAGEADLSKLVMEKRVDGLIMPAELTRDSVVTLLENEKLPFIIFGKSGETNANWLDLDNTMGGRIAAQKMIDGGAQTIGFVTNSFEKVFAQERFSGYCQALEAAGQTVEEKWVFTDRYSNQDGVELILSQTSFCDAYVVTDNMVAFGMLRGLMQKKKSVPDEVQIISFDDSVASRLSEPPMTVVDIDVFQLGTKAALMILEQLKGTLKQGESCLMPVTIVERETSK